MNTNNLLNQQLLSAPISTFAHDEAWNGRGESNVPAPYLRELANHIATNGQRLQISCMKIPFSDEIEALENRYEKETWLRIKENYPTASFFVVAGNLRFLAMRLAAASGIVNSNFELVFEDKEFPNLAAARVWNIEENQAGKAGQLPLTPYQQASQVVNMLSKEKLAPKVIADIFGYTPAWVSQMKSLINLSEYGWIALRCDLIKPATAKALAKLPADKQREAIDKELYTQGKVDGFRVELEESGAIQTKESRAASPNRSTSHSVGLKSSREFSEWVDSLRSIRANQKCPEVALLSIIAGFFHAQTKKDTLLEVAKFVNRQGRYAHLVDTGAIDFGGLKAASAEE